MLMLLLCLTGCSRPELIKLKGSDTVLPLGQGLAEHFYGQDVDFALSVTGGGSGVGINALVSQNTDLAMSSRHIKLKEVLLLKANDLAYEELTVAYDALAVVVNPQNPISRLTREQLEAIFTGTITNWKDVGGLDLSITAYSRETSSGTYEFFREMVLDKQEFSPRCLMEQSTGSLVESIKSDRAAIAYIGVAYLNPEVKPLAVSFDQGQTFVEPTLQNAEDRSYPIVRPLYFYYLTKNKPKLEPLLAYLRSPQSREVVLASGAIPVVPVR
jgi:phosphate transport system substrate-binding protein